MPVQQKDKSRAERPTPAVTFLSLGWGVQSFTLAAMVALGELEGLDVAVHADTTHEAEATYDFARRWTPWLGEHGITVITVRAEEPRFLRENKNGTLSIEIPAFTVNKATGEPGQMNRQCTSNWKIKPLRKYVRSLLPGGWTYPSAIECWQGISLDEFQRMRTSDVQYIVNSYPLVERRMSRMDCIAWLESHGLEVPPKSACVFCPFHSLGYWQNLKRQGGADWEYAELVDGAIRSKRDEHDKFTRFVHPARIPLASAVSIPEDIGAFQVEFEFDRPCDGGVCFT